MASSALKRIVAIVILTTVCVLGRAQADVVTEWNAVALQATANPPNSILQSRVLAVVHCAVYDAVRSLDRKTPSCAVDIAAPPGTSAEAAVVAAAHGVLVRLAPAERTMLDGALKLSLSKLPDGRGKTQGTEIGAQIAERAVTARAADGAAAKAEFTPKPGPGLYQLTPPQMMPAILAHWGSVKPFVLAGTAGFDFKGPPPLSSAEFAREFDEVKSLGARNSATRSADQTAAAIFWTVQTAIPWHAAARAASEARGLSLFENARLFALLSLATADSQIVTFAEKYARPHWRPMTAIRAAADLNIPALKGDRNWEPLLVTPPHPQYPSAHAAFSGAAEAALRKYFGNDNVKVSVTAPGVFGVTRTYDSFSAMTDEVNDARVWGGIHFRSADTDGADVGRRIGEVVMREFPNSTRKSTQLEAQP
jgi:hypothetical protein